LKAIRIKHIFKTSLLCLISLVLISANTSMALAASSSSSSSTSSSSKTPPNNTYTYDPATGNWVNGQYSWDPTTGQTTPLTPGEYTYNATTGKWDSNEYTYDAQTGTYVPTSSISAPTPSSSNSDNDQSTAPLNASNTGTASNSSGGTSSNNQFFDGYTSSAISNNINSSAASGNAAVNGNTTAGGAESGNALSTANVLNLLQSSTGLSGDGYSSFVANINGDVNGNLLIDPSSLSTVTSSNPSDITINNATNNQINNNITLDALSGNADIADNTNGGSATSGSADAVANVINLIDSAISADQSFIGEINIYGDLTGNILVPDLLSDDLATNSGTSNLSSNLTSSDTNTSAINNDINTSAQSGKATVTDNTNAGDAATGSASTNVTILNLTGQQVVAANSLLVFVNVLGQWVGLIMNAPTGTTSALLASGVSQDAANLSASSNTAINANTLNEINNNIVENSKSGNALVADNTNGGNAVSGNASDIVNLANISNSSFNFSGWFGVLFINVFGNWNGSLESSLASAVTTDQSSSPTGGLNPTTTFLKFVPNGNNNVNTTFASSNNSSVSGSASALNGNLSADAASYLQSSNKSLGTFSKVSTVPQLAKLSSSSSKKIGLAIALGSLIPLVAVQILSRKQRRV
jgi:hypothetical protein